MKSLLKEAIDDEAIKVTEHVIKRRNDKTARLEIASLVHFKAVTAADAVQKTFYNNLFVKYWNTQLKYVRVALAEQLMQPTPDYPQMKITVDEFLKDIQNIFEMGVITPDLFGQIQNFSQICHDAIDARSNGEIPKNKNYTQLAGKTLTNPEQIALLKNNFVFYLKDEHAKKYIESKRANVTQTLDKVSITGEWSLDGDASLKIRKLASGS